MLTPYPSGTRLHVKVAGPTVFFYEPGNPKSAIPLKASGKRNDYRPWQTNEYAGFATGKTFIVAGEVWQEVELELVIWKTQFLSNFRESRLAWFKPAADVVQSEAEYRNQANKAPDATPTQPNTGTVTGTPIGGTTTGINFLPSTGTTAADLASKSTNNTTLYVIIGVAVLLVGGVLFFLFKSPNSKKR